MSDTTLLVPPPIRSAHPPVGGMLSRLHSDPTGDGVIALHAHVIHEDWSPGLKNQMAAHIDQFHSDCDTIGA